MLDTLCLCLTATAAVALELTRTKLADPDISNLQHYTYSDFVDEFKRKISPSFEEWPVREALFKANLQKVQVLRNVPGMKWVPGVTKFMDYHDYEYSKLLGYKGRRTRAGLTGIPRKLSVHDHNSDSFSSNNFFPDNQPLGATKQGAMLELKAPAMYSAIGSNSTAGIVHDQGLCGSCWAEAALTVLEGAVMNDFTLMQKIQSHTDTTQVLLSRDYTISCTQNPGNCGGIGGCNGATPELAFKLAWEVGIPMETLVTTEASDTGVARPCPQQQSSLHKIRIKGWTNLPVNVPHVRQALAMHGGPMSVAVDASNWNLYKSGVYSDTDMGSVGEFTVNHIVALVGYDARPPHPYYLIKNSWGSDFGESGYIRLEIKSNEASHCGWDKETHLGIACDDESDKAWVCGTCGILYDISFPTGAYME